MPNNGMPNWDEMLMFDWLNKVIFSSFPSAI